MGDPLLLTRPWRWIAREPGRCVAVGRVDACARLPLSAAEVAQLRALGGSVAEASRWRAGRGLARAALRAWDADAPDPDLLRAESGAPEPRGAGPRGVSLSHDRGWVAVAWSRAGAVGVDLCAQSRRGAARRVLAGLGVDGAVGPLAAWGALEAALKLRGQAVTRLLSATPRVEREGRGAVVRGLGHPVRCAVAETEDYTLVWTEGECTS